MILMKHLMASAAALIMTAEASAAAGRNFSCAGGDKVLPSTFSPEFKNFIKEKRPNMSLRRIVVNKMDVWVSNYMLQQCNAWKNGDPYHIGCMADIIPFDEFVSSIPKDYWNMSAGDLNPIATRAENASRVNGEHPATASRQYCEDIGAVTWR